MYLLSHSYFHPPKRTTRKTRNKIILLIQTLKDIENLTRRVAGYDLSFDQFKELGRKSWEEDFIFLYID